MVFFSLSKEIKIMDSVQKMIIFLKQLLDFNAYFSSKSRQIPKRLKELSKAMKSLNFQSGDRLLLVGTSRCPLKSVSDDHPNYYISRHCMKIDCEIHFPI